MKHSFEVGDRVRMKKSTKPEHIGQLGQIWQGTHPGKVNTLIGIKFDDDKLHKLRTFYSTHVTFDDSLYDYYDHDTNIQPGDWVRHESVNTFDRDLDDLTFQLDPFDTFNKPGPRGIILTSCGNSVYRENCIKIQPPTKESTMKTDPKQTPLQQWKAVYYPIPASEMKDKSDLECLDHAIQKWRGFYADVIEEYGVERGKLPIGDTSCSLCTKYHDASRDCPSCPLVMHGSGCCLDDESIYERANLRKGNIPQLMLNELIQVKKKVQEAVTKEKKKPEFYVNGDGPYDSIHITSGPYNVAVFDKSGYYVWNYIKQSDVGFPLDENGAIKKIV